MQSTTIYEGLSPVSGRPVRVTARDGRIESMESAPDADVSTWLAPGLIDLQVNGFAAVDYNSPETPVDEIGRSLEVQRATGVSRLLPTVITGSHENICGSLKRLVQAKHELAMGRMIAGFHVEGPWISPEDGPRGAHPKAHVRGASTDEFDRFQEAAEGRIRIVTLAPEPPNATQVIEHMVRAGVVVSLGHHNATREQIHDAISAGATMCTHLGNGAHSTVKRHENILTYQMAADALIAGLIVDGIHLPADFVKNAVRAKQLERIFLVTDAAPPAGAEPGVYRFGHIEVELTPDQAVRLTDSGRLAGSALAMDRGVGNLVRFAGLTLEEAWRAGSTAPARAIGLDRRTGFLEPGDDADLVRFEWDADAQQVKTLETFG